MHKTDVTLLAQNLNAIAEVYERKHVTAKALEVWYDTLKAFPTERIMGLLIGWPKTHGKFPTPAEIWKACNESSVEEREEKARQERVMNAAPWTGSTPEGRRLCALTKEILSRPKPTGKDYWRKLLETAKPGSIGHQYASEVLKVDQQRQETEAQF